ncbi:MAG: hypothetical protein A2V88_09265 [Elusimicrobia bacterium RBG_16_66_12]|nr:MAG: hypothetical protein A2V88_09265 [Elusimicrobia bacterium RBG_16_66_12]
MKPLVPSPSPPSPPGASFLDDIGGKSLALRSGFFLSCLLCWLLLRFRPDRWSFPNITLEGVLLAVVVWSVALRVAYAFMAPLIDLFTGIILPIAGSLAAACLLIFDRVAYVPAFRVCRLRLPPWPSFILALAVESVLIFGLLALAWR